MDIKIFNKIIYDGIKKSPETIDFLVGQAQEIFNLQLQSWEANNKGKDYKNQDIWREIYCPAEKKFSKYLIDWFYGVRENINIRLFHETMPYEINMIFEHFLDEVMSNIDLGEIAIEIMIEIYDNFKDKQNLEK